MSWHRVSHSTAPERHRFPTGPVLCLPIPFGCPKYPWASPVSRSVVRQLNLFWAVCWAVVPVCLCIILLAKLRWFKLVYLALNVGQTKADSFAFAGGQSTPMDNNRILADVMICQTMVSLSFLRKGETASEKTNFYSLFSRLLWFKLGLSPKGRYHE